MLKVYGAPGQNVDGITDRRPCLLLHKQPPPQFSSLSLLPTRCAVRRLGCHLFLCSPHVSLLWHLCCCCCCAHAHAPNLLKHTDMLSIIQINRRRPLSAPVPGFKTNMICVRRDSENILKLCEFFTHTKLKVVD